MSRRLEKVAALLQQYAATVLNQEFVFPGLATSVTKVDVSPDLRNARVYIGMVGRGQEEAKPRIEKAAPGAIAAYLASRTDLRTVPHIRIVFDDSGEYAEHISQLIDGIE